MVDQEDLAAANSYMTQIQGVRRTIQPRTAADIAGVIAQYSDISPDLAASMAMSTLPSDYQDMGTIIRRDMVQKPSVGRFLRNSIPFAGDAAANVIGTVGAGAAWGTRQLTAGMYDLWDVGIPRQLRTGVNIYKDMQDGGDFDLMRNVRRSYGSIAGEMAQQIGQGEMTPGEALAGKGLGTGVMVGRPEDVRQMPGYGTTFSQRLLEGDTPAEAESYTDKWALDKFGYDVVNGAWQNAEATRLNVTVDGVDYDYGVSLGRLALTPAYTAQLITPETIPARLITGTIDTGSQVWFDPTDVISDSMTRSWARFRKLQPNEVSSVDNLLADAGGQKITDFTDDAPSVEGYEFRGGTAEGATGGGTDQLLDAIVDAEVNDEAFVHVYRQGDLEVPDNMSRVEPELEGYQRIVRETEFNRSNRIEYLVEENETFADAIDEGMDAWDARIYLTEVEAEELAKVIMEEADANLELTSRIGRIQDTTEAIPLTSIPVADAEEMLSQRYFFVEGRGMMDEALAYLDKNKISRVRGRWEARKPEEFLADKDGKGLVDWLADEAVPRYKKVERLRSSGIPMSDIDNWLRAIDRNAEDIETALQKALFDDTIQIPDELDQVQHAYDNVEAWINGQRMTRRVTSPGSYRAANKIENAAARLVGESVRPQPVRPFSEWGRRWAAHSTDSKIDPYDMDTTFETIVQFMRTIPGTTDEGIDKIVTLSLRGRGQPAMPGTVRRALMEEVEAAWKRGDIDDELIVRTLERFFDEQEKQVFYNVDSLVNPIAEADTLWKWEQTPGGLMFRVPANQASMAVELSASANYVPSIRQVRRATSTARRYRAKYLARVQADPDSKLLMDDAEMQRLADIASASWRTMQLLRPGWMMSVTPDEFARSVFDGHADLFANPMTAYKVFFKGAGDEMPMGTALSELVEGTGGLGAGMQSGMRAAERDTLQLLNQSGKPGGAWIPIRVLDDEGNITRQASEAYVREWVRHYNDPISRLLYEYDGDLLAAEEYLTARTSPGRQVLQDILDGGGHGAYPDPEIRLGQIDPDTTEGRKAIRTLLELTEARRHLMTGGDWIKRDPLIPDRWVDSAGQQVELYNAGDWTRDELLDEVNRLLVERGEVNPVGLDRMNKADLQTVLLDFNDHTRGILDFPADQTYNIFKRGDSDLRNVLGGGSLSPERLPDFDARSKALTQWGNQADVLEGDRMFIIVDDVAADAAPSNVRVLDEIAAELAQVGDEVLARDLEKMNRIIRLSRDSGGMPKPGSMGIQGQVLFDRLHAAALRRIGGADEIPVGSRVVKSANQASTTAGKAQRVILVDMTQLSDEAQLRLMEGTVGGKMLDDIVYEPKAMRSMGGDELVTATDEVADASERVLISSDMDSQELDNVASFVRDRAFTEGYNPVPFIKGQGRSLVERETTSTQLIDTVFDVIGRQASEKLVRTPYVRIKTWEGIADAYLHASPTIRKQIRIFAGKADFSPAEFEAIVSRQMRIAGFKELPAPAKVQLTIAEIEAMAVARAVQRTRDLFFDLTERSNFWDASKLIFPFGDAWWEVLSRWTKLFNPMKADEFGRPFKNLSRLESASVGAQRSGYYDVDEQGDRVFSWFPTTALNQAILEQVDVPEGMNAAYTTTMGQALFIDPADPRSVFGPGGSVQVQTAAAIFRPFYEDKAVSDLIDWAVYGSYNPTELSSASVVDSILPSYLRRFWDLLQVGEYDETYASRQVDLMNGMYASDPKYADALTNQATQQLLVDDAKQMTIQMAVVEAVASWLGKVPRMSVEVMTLDSEGSEQARKLIAISTEYAWLMNEVGMSQKEAVATVRSQYGVDPLAISPKSYSVYSRPLTKTGYDFMLRNEDDAALLPVTIAAFMPQTNGEEFYYQEYQREMDADERQKLTATQSLRLASYRAGLERMQVIKNERDLKLAQAKAFYGTDSDIYRSYRDNEVAEWYNRARMNIENSYFYEEGVGGPQGFMKRPTPEDGKKEMVKVGTPGTPEHEAGVRMDTQLTLALERVTAAWVANEEMALTMGKSPSWWYESSASTDQEAAVMRSTFQERLYRIVATLDDDTKRKMSYYVDSVMTPLLQGFDRDTPLVIDVAPLPLPGG